MDARIEIVPRLRTQGRRENYCGRKEIESFHVRIYLNNDGAHIHTIHVVA